MTTVGIEGIDVNIGNIGILEILQIAPPPGLRTPAGRPSAAVTETAFKTPLQRVAAKAPFPTRPPTRSHRRLPRGSLPGIIGVARSIAAV